MPNPIDTRINHYLDHCREIIAQHGYMLQRVISDGTTVGFTYSVGLSARHGAELIAFGLPPDVATDLLMTLIERLDDGPIPDGEDILGIANSPLRLYSQSVPDNPNPLAVARALGYDARRVRILRWPDAEGRFPGAPGYCHMVTQSFDDISENTPQ